MRRPVIILSLLLAASCTPREEVVQVQGERAKQSCRVYGYAEGTREFARCTLQEAQANQQAAMRPGSSTVTASQQPSSAPVGVVPAMATCTPRQFGNSITTMCQ